MSLQAVSVEMKCEFHYYSACTAGCSECTDEGLDRCSACQSGFIHDGSSTCQGKLQSKAVCSIWSCNTPCLY